MKLLPNVISVAWAERLDNANDFAKRLGVESFCIYYQPFKLNYLFFVPLRYFVQSFRTWKLLIEKKPDLILVTNPPIVLALNVFVYCKIFGSKYLLENHSPALYSDKWSWSVPLLRFVARKAVLNIIDQDRYKVLFESWGAQALVLAKMPRKFTPSKILSDSNKRFNITVVNTFAPDEPLKPILDAARQLTDVHFYILGDYRLANQAIISDLPANITLTGWLNHDDYWNQLKQSRAVMTLTTYEYSIVAGGTDGMAVGCPLILSDQPALKEYFIKGTIFVENCCNSIVSGIRQLQQNEYQYKEEIHQLANEKILLWESMIIKIEAIIAGEV